MSGERYVSERVAFASGQSAYRSGEKVGDNPYDEKSSEHWEWMSGWVTAAESGSCMRGSRKALAQVTAQGKEGETP
jgi:hypothetical protein